MNRRLQYITRPLLALLVATAGCGWGRAETKAGQDKSHVPDSFSVAAVGDLICTYPIKGILERSSPGLLDILHKPDITFGNYEDTALDLDAFKGAPQAEAGGSWLLATKDQPADLAAMGFDLVSRANNHATDWGAEGMRDTNRALDRAGVAHAGTGDTMAAARAPRFLEGKSVRTALIALTSTFTPMSRAMDPLGELSGRPGVNALRARRVVTVSPERFAALESLRAAVPPTEWTARPPAGTVLLETTSYRPDPLAGDKVVRSFETDPQDESEILRNVDQGKKASDFAIVSMHSHEFHQSKLEPADFMRDFARKAIDKGADMIVGHGPHLLRGIEIYKGRPIFYSLANFCHMDDPLQPLPRDHFELLGADPDVVIPAEYMHHWREVLLKNPQYLESVVAVSRFDQSGVGEIRLYPIHLDALGRASRRGLPVLATGEAARSILERLRDLSRPFGTDIAIENDVGIVRVRRSASKD